MKFNTIQKTQFSTRLKIELKIESFESSWISSPLNCLHCFFIVFSSIFDRVGFQSSKNQPKSMSIGKIYFQLDFSIELKRLDFKKLNQNCESSFEISKIPVLIIPLAMLVLWKMASKATHWQCAREWLHRS